jgi:hypothetical protein
MLVSDSGKITMTVKEWHEFAGATFAPWRPRTRREFEAMIDLGIARHLAENTGGQGFMFAIAADGMRFGPDGEVNFPANQRKLAYARITGNWPTDSELADYESGSKVPPPAEPSL